MEWKFVLYFRLQPLFENSVAPTNVQHVAVKVGVWTTGTALKLFFKSDDLHKDLNRSKTLKTL